MKINHKLLAITFLTIALTTSITMVMTYDLARRAIFLNQQKALNNSYGNFLFQLHVRIQQAGEAASKKASDQIPESAGYDFRFKLNSRGLIIPGSFSKKASIGLAPETSLSQFLKAFPNSLLSYKKANNDYLYYGILLNGNLLSEISKSCGAEVCLLIKGKLSVGSNSRDSLFIESALGDILAKSAIPGPYVQELPGRDFIASYYRAENLQAPDQNLAFLIYSRPSEGANFRYTLKIIMAIALPTGIALSLILVLLFTARMRRQLGMLANTAEQAGKGNLACRAEIISDDETGRLGNTFNLMLDRLDSRERDEKAYSDFMAVLNSKSELSELAEEAVKKILDFSGASSGAIYIRSKDSFKLVYPGGRPQSLINPGLVLENKEIREYQANEPELESITMVPLYCGEMPVGVLEVNSAQKLDESKKSFILKLRDQLAIGISNALVLKELERISKMKTEFLATMSHELKTPLISILGLTGLMLKGTKTEETKQRLIVVKRNGEKLLRLIESILEFSRIEAGEMEIREEKFYLRSFISEINSYIRTSFASESVDYRVDLPPGDLLLNTDKTKLEHIILNLLANAFKFTEKGLVELRLFRKNESDLEITVRDTGIGIAEADKELIFESFKQADSSISRKYGGTGLGLSIASRYVKSLMGNIGLESNISKGSLFSVSIPGIVESGLGEEKTKPGEPYVLVAGEGERTKKFISEYLSINGLTVKTASGSYAEIIKLMSKELISLIICSSIRNQECWSILREVKSSEFSGIPVIISFHADSERLGYAIETYDYAFLPMKEDALKQTISSAEKSCLSEIKRIACIEVEPPKSENIEFQKVETSDDICDAIARIKPDLILIGLSAQVANGITRIHRFKEDPRTKKLPIILMLPQNFNKEDAISIGLVLSQIIFELQTHPQDLLKVLRDRFLIEPREEIRQMLLIEDSAETVISSGKKRLMIVDDDRDTLFTLRQIVEDLGYETEVASNGIECLAKLRVIKPDLILLDIMMPQMDGFETIKRIRGSRILMDIPVVALTAHQMLENREVIYRNGFTDSITKPIDREELLSKIIKNLK